MYSTYLVSISVVFEHLPDFDVYLCHNTSVQHQVFLPLFYTVPRSGIRSKVTQEECSLGRN